MRIVFHVCLIVLSAWWIQSLLMEGSRRLAPQGALDLAVIALMAAAALACLHGAIAPRKRWLLLGIANAALLAVIAVESQTWHRLIPLPAWQALLVAYAAVAAIALFLARWPTFRSGELRIHDGRNPDHLSVGKDSGDMVVFRHGYTMCRQQAETRSETRYGGGTSVVPTTGTVTTYGPDGVGYGTVYGTQVVSTPVFSYDVSVRTGRVDYLMEEVGPDHALLIAKRPRYVHIRARHEAWHREKSATFTLGAWAAFRFDLWKRLHAKAFFHEDRSMPRRISRAASTHLSAMKKAYGRTSSRELTLDHDLALVSFVGLARDKVFVHLADPQTSLTIRKSDPRPYWRQDAINVPGSRQAIRPGGKIKAALSEWVQLAALRDGRRDAR